MRSREDDNRVKSETAPDKLEKLRDREGWGGRRVGETPDFLVPRFIRRLRFRVSNGVLKELKWRGERKKNKSAVAKSKGKA